jgi:uncharacterized protein (DUF983 family)
MKKINGLQAAAMGKCPRCREGNMFKKHILNPFSLTEMNDKCEKCDLIFEREPGFFGGAMYVSYAISVGLFLVIGFSVFFILNDPPTWVYMTVITSIVLLIFPFNFKYSRVLFLHIFGDVHYDPESTKAKS